MDENVWVYRPVAAYQSGMDLTGFKVEASDGSIGKVDKHSEDVGAAYIVVDTGTWIFGKEVLLLGRGRGARRPEGKEDLRRPHQGPDQERARVRQGEAPRQPGLPPAGGHLLRAPASATNDVERPASPPEPVPSGDALTHSIGEVAHILARGRSGSGLPTAGRPAMATGCPTRHPATGHMGPAGSRACPCEQLVVSLGGAAWRGENFSSPGWQRTEWRRIGSVMAEEAMDLYTPERDSRVQELELRRLEGDGRG